MNDIEFAEKHYTSQPMSAERKCWNDPIYRSVVDCMVNLLEKKLVRLKDFQEMSLLAERIYQERCMQKETIK